jgi:hypothetical protein
MQHWRTTSLGIGIRFLLASLIIFQAALSSAAMARMDTSRLTSTGSLQLVICTPDGISTITQKGGRQDGGGHAALCDCGMVCCAVNARLGGTDTGNLAVPVATSVLILGFGHDRNRHLTGKRDGLNGAPRAPPFAT